MEQEELQHQQITKVTHQHIDMENLDVYYIIYHRKQKLNLKIEVFLFK
jgi:hypothetical protein